MKRVVLVLMIAGLLPAQSPQECYTCLAQECHTLQGEISSLESNIAWAEGAFAALTVACKYGTNPFIEASACGSAAGVAALIPYMKYQLTTLKSQYTRLGCWAGMPL